MQPCTAVFFVYLCLFLHLEVFHKKYDPLRTLVVFFVHEFLDAIYPVEKNMS